MSDDREVFARGNPRPVPPDRDPRLGPHPNPGGSIVEELGEVVDDLRQLYTDFGLRPYRVFSVVVSWSGGEIGRGLPKVASEQEILPTPEVDLRAMRTDMKTGGKVEGGSATLREVSPRFTEDDIELLFHVQPLPAGCQGFVEVQHDRRDGLTKRRRFVVRGPAQRNVETFEWIVPLASQEPNRERSGQIKRGHLQGQRRRG